MNSYNVAEKTNSTGQNSLSFGAKQFKMRFHFKTPNEIKLDERERLLSDAFERAINIDKKNKNKEHIFNTAKKLIAFYMLEKPSMFFAKAEEIGVKLNKNIGEVGLKLKDELVGCFPSINIVKNISGKKPAKACVDHIINNTTYKRLSDHIDLVKGVRAADNLEFFD